MVELVARARAVHAGNADVRTLVTTELCQTDPIAKNGSCTMPYSLTPDVIDSISLWVPMIQYVAGRSPPPYVASGHKACKNVPLESQRSAYDFATANGQHDDRLWWYLACFSDGDCCAGPDRACTAEEKERGLPCSNLCLMGWPSYMARHDSDEHLRL